MPAADASMTSAPPCPSCGDGSVSPLMVGYPEAPHGPDDPVAAGETALAGSSWYANAPARRCWRCGHPFGRESGQMGVVNMLLARREGRA